MITILSSLILAWLFSIIAYAIYGLEGVMTIAWIDQVYASIIIAGLSLAVVKSFSHSKWAIKIKEKICHCH